MKTIVTMTSWKGRINHTAFGIYLFLSSQTVKPDLMYLWLAEEEFPNREQDLPIELVKLCFTFKVQIKWIPFNEYVHKRWYVYPEHNDDLVISIDEDQCFDKDLIKDAISICNKQPNTSYNIFSKITCDIMPLNDIAYKRTPVSNNVPSLTTNMNGVHIFPPRTFPLNAITPENLIIRRQICKQCDESWLLPFLKHNKGRITYINQKSILDSLPCATDGTALHRSNSVKINGYRKRDLQLYIVLRRFPELMNSWKTIFPTYNTEQLDDVPFDTILSWIS